MQTDLPGSQDDGGQLGPVTPLGHEGKGECLQEDGRNEALPLPLGLGISGAGLDVRYTVG